MPSSVSWFLGIDSGTSGCRAWVVDEHKSPIASCEVQSPGPAVAGNKVTVDPRQWWDDLVRLMAKLGKQIPLAPIAAMALDATSGTLLLADADGNPAGPALMYNDKQAVGEARQIATIAPSQSGAHGSTSGLAKLLFLLNQGIEGRFALHHHDWLCGRLTGRWGISDENNALKLGYDPIERRWPVWLKTLGFSSSLLPEVVPPGTVIGNVTTAITDVSGLSPSTRVVAGTTDSVAATIACGIAAPGEAVTSLGSTLALKLLSDQPVFAPPHGVYSHRIHDKWLAGGASNSGGAVLKHYFDTDQLDRLSRQIDPSKEPGLDYYPLLAPGERFPVNDPHWPPRLSPRPADDSLFLHGLLEGIARIEDLGYRCLQQHGAPVLTRVYTAGGGARNPTWLKMRQRILGVPVEAAEHQDAAYGAALIARAGYLNEPVL